MSSPCPCGGCTKAYAQGRADVRAEDLAAAKEIRWTLPTVKEWRAWSRAGGDPSIVPMCAVVRRSDVLDLLDPLEG
jgi:hypothetical protein